MYYDLVRELLLGYFERAIKHSGVSNGVAWLSKRRDQWMEMPQPDLTGMMPREAIEQERLRLPLVDRHDGVIDEDCPVCRMSAELGLGPTFFYLDTSHFDDEFEFSMHADEEQWVVEQTLFDESRNVYRSEDVADAQPNYQIPAHAIWQRVFVNQEMLGRSITEDVMAIGFFLAELVEDLQCRGASHDLVNQLNRHFDNLTPASRDNSSLMQPAISRLGETIDDVSQQCPELAEKCLDLQNHLARMAEMLD